MKLEFSRHIFNNTHIPNFMKIRPVGAELCHTGGQTDMTKLTVTFTQFWEGALRNQTISTTNSWNGDLPVRLLWANTPALLTRMSTPPRLFLTHLKVVLISHSLETSHLTAYSLPLADRRDSDSSCDTVNMACISKNIDVFYYSASCRLA